MMESKQILCCRAKTWSLVIGWTQAVLCGVGIAAFLVSFLIYTIASSADEVTVVTYYDNSTKIIGQISQNVTSSNLDDEVDALVIGGMLISICTLVIGLAAGIILIIGTTQGSAKKLKFWLFLNGVFMIFSILSFVMGILSDIGFAGLIRDILILMLGFFCIWIVNVHRREILNTGMGRVIYGVRI